MLSTTISEWARLKKNTDSFHLVHTVGLLVSVIWKQEASFADGLRHSLSLLKFSQLLHNCRKNCIEINDKNSLKLMNVIEGHSPSSEMALFNAYCNKCDVSVFIYLSKHQRQRAQATYMTVKSSTMNVIL